MTYSGSLTNELIFELMCRRILGNTDSRALFGDCFSRMRTSVPPFLIGDEFPELYIEFPLKGDPFVDVSVLYGDLDKDSSIESVYAGNCADMLNTYSKMRKENPDVCCGFELDTSASAPYPAAVHFEPYSHTDLVIPFCDSIGARSYGQLYLKAFRRLGPDLAPSFFGVFRGRSDAPLRICGYIEKTIQKLICEDPGNVKKLFDKSGFTSYNDDMLVQISEAMNTAPIGIDYQMDIFPDESIGDVFSLDIALAENASDAVRRSLSDGASSRVIAMLHKYGIADERIHALSDIAASFAVPDQKKDGSSAVRTIIIKPAWIKIRWKAGKLQNAKCYCRLKSFLL